MKNVIKSLGVIVLATVIVVSIAYATTGSFTAPAGTTPINNYRTLGDIYSKLINFNLNPTATHSISTTTSPAGSMYTLGDIYGLLTAENADIVPSKIKDGEVIFGVRGTYTGAGGPAPTLIWTKTFPTVTVVNGAQILQAGFVKNLCWSTQSTLERDSCTTRQIGRPQYIHNPDPIIGGFYEANPNVGPNGENSIPLGAVEYCDYLNSNGTTVETTPQHYWRLPTQMELFLEASMSVISGVENPAEATYGGFHAYASSPYWSSEFTERNYSSGWPTGFHDSVKTVIFEYLPSSPRTDATLFQTMRSSVGTYFRCVHQN